MNVPISIQRPVRVGFKNPCLKDATDRVIIPTPYFDEWSQERFEQWKADLESIAVMVNNWSEPRE